MPGFSLGHPEKNASALAPAEIFRDQGWAPALGDLMGFRPGPGRGACESAAGPTRDGGDRSGFAVWHEIEGGPLPAQPTLEAFSEPGPPGDAVLAESAPPQNLREAAAIVGTIEPSRSDYHPE